MTIRIPSPILSQLETREAALWIVGGLTDECGAERLAELCKLPWNVVLSEVADPLFISTIELPDDVSSFLISRRGLVYPIDTDPAKVPLPPRHLAIYLLNGRTTQRQTGIAALTRRLTMLADLRRRPLKQIVIVVNGSFTIPESLSDLWDDGFRTILTFVTNDSLAASIVESWKSAHPSSLVDVIEANPSQFTEALTQNFLSGRGSQSTVRLRNKTGILRQIDISGTDDPERPLLESYEILGNEVLTPLLPSDLTRAEVDEFFSDASASWRPYAAGIAWERDPNAWRVLRSRLQALDKKGPEENRVFYVPSESGAGATTFLRDLAHRSAAEGYMVLIARRGLSVAGALDVVNFINGVLSTAEEQTSDGGTKYETPCVIIFDQEHWAGRENDLIAFSREIERSGRRVCILISCGPYVAMTLLTDRRCTELTQLTHQIPSAHADALGRHLNKFLAPHGTNRSDHEWRAFFRASSVHDGQSVAAFWIVLSFWLKRQIDIGETLQSRIYRQFMTSDVTADVRLAILRIAAFSTVRLPLPDEMLPKEKDWPMAIRLEDLRKELGFLGLQRILADRGGSWAMAHDILGRYLMSGLFYDFEARQALGFESAKNPEHLRFLVLRDVAHLSVIQSNDLKDIADSFAVSIFKIDPDHGYATFVPFWEEVIEALDQMPRVVRTTSRTFLHHTSISRRRICADQMLFPLTPEERLSIISRAVDDLESALRLDVEYDDETEINLFNSLAHAYHDLAEAKVGADRSATEINAARASANDATRRAFLLNPDNSFVVETYARNLLSQAASEASAAIPYALEVLNLVYSQMAKPSSELRRNQLGRLAEKAFDLLFDNAQIVAEGRDLSSETGTICAALAELAKGISKVSGFLLQDYPLANRIAAERILASPLLRGNVQAIKLRYMLLVMQDPNNFDEQLNILEQLDGSGPAFTPQMQLELAVLLYQRDRSHEGDRLFSMLRGLWHRGDFYVEVPARLHWLLDVTHTTRRQVKAKVAPGNDGRSYAKVLDFQGIRVPFRSTEFGEQRLRPGDIFSALVTFGHNGPLLRPLNAAIK